MNPDQMRDASLLELFQLETRNQVQVLNNGLLALEHDPTSAAQLEACMRAAHSLKGAARIVDLHPAVRIAHAMEAVSYTHLDVYKRQTMWAVWPASRHPSPKLRVFVDHLAQQLFP